jgi:hypothetical protein
MRTLIRTNFCSTTLQSFECSCLGLKGRKKRPKKLKYFSILSIFSKVEVQKLNVYACLKRLIKPDTKKITSDLLWWEVLPGHLIKNDHFWLVKSFFKNWHSTFKRAYLPELNFWHVVDFKLWLELKLNILKICEFLEKSLKNSQNVKNQKLVFGKFEAK